MRTLKNVFSNLHRYVLWALLSVLLWAWIFAMIDDAIPAKKISLFIDAPCSSRSLSVELEKELPEGMKMIRARPMTYVAFGGNAMEFVDLYIFRESDLEKYREGLMPFTPPEDVEAKAYVSGDGQVYGLRVYDAATGQGVAKEFIQYDQSEQPTEDYYICIGIKTKHLEATWQVLLHFLELV